MKRYLVNGLFWLAVLAWTPAEAQPAETAAEAPTLVFGIVPQQAASKLAGLWLPILDHLGKASGTQLVFATAPDIPTFEKRLAAGDYDVAYMNPYHYAVFSSQPGYRAIGKEKGIMLKGIIVVRKDSPIKDIKELNALTLAFPAPAAFAASVLPRSYLAKQGIVFTPKYVASHDSVYLGVQSGLYPAGGGIVRTLDNIRPEVKDQLRVLWTTPPFTPHAIAAHPRVAPELLARLKDSMYRMDEDPAGRALLANVEFLGIAPAQDSDWNDVRALSIDLINDQKQGAK